jgi:hypothetical protein
MMTVEITGVSQCRGGLAPAASLKCRSCWSGGECCLAVPGPVGGDDRIPGLPGGDDGMQVPQDRGGDDGLRLGGRELVLVPAGQVLVAGAVDRVDALGSPDRPPGRQAQPWAPLAGEPGPAPVKAPDSFSRWARSACLTGARAVANRLGSPISAKIAAAPTGDSPVIDSHATVTPAHPFAAARSAAQSSAAPSRGSPVLRARFGSFRDSWYDWYDRNMRAHVPSPMAFPRRRRLSGHWSDRAARARCRPRWQRRPPARPGRPHQSGRPNNARASSDPQIAAANWTTQ